jgi:hypothetical protein
MVKLKFAGFINIGTIRSVITTGFRIGATLE